MTYVVPDVSVGLRYNVRCKDNTFIDLCADNKFDYKKFKTHIWDKQDVDGYIKCLYCNLEARIYKSTFKYYFCKTNLTCDEYAIKSIIE